MTEATKYSVQIVYGGEQCTEPVVEATEREAQDMCLMTEMALEKLPDDEARKVTDVVETFATAVG